MHVHAFAASCCLCLKSEMRKGRNMHAGITQVMQTQARACSSMSVAVALASSCCICRAEGQGVPFTLDVDGILRRVPRGVGQKKTGSQLTQLDGSVTGLKSNCMSTRSRFNARRRA